MGEGLVGVPGAKLQAAHPAVRVRDGVPLTVVVTANSDVPSNVAMAQQVVYASSKASRPFRPSGLSDSMNALTSISNVDFGRWKLVTSASTTWKR